MYLLLLHLYTDWVTHLLLLHLHNKEVVLDVLSIPSFQLLHSMLLLLYFIQKFMSTWNFRMCFYLEIFLIDVVVKDLKVKLSYT